MIVLPRRSVTRFFIPMIDVLTLLFCIFLLLPLLPDRDEAPPPVASGPIPENERPAEAVARQLQQEIKDLEVLRRDRRDLVRNRLAVHALEIDGATGRLRDLEGKEIATEADALARIDRDRSRTPDKDLFYTILYPRRGIGYPSNRQRLRYDTWFRDVAHEFDVPSDAE